MDQNHYTNTEYRRTVASREEALYLPSNLHQPQFVQTW